MREGEGATLRGSTRMRDGAGETARGSTRTRSGALLERGALDHVERDGALRRAASPTNASRGGARRGVGLLRSRASADGVTRARVTSEGTRLLDKRMALGGGAVRTAGTA